MEMLTRIERALTVALTRAEVGGCPPGLAAAVRHSVFPKGSRIRPRLCISVAEACGDPRPELTDAAAVAIELLHCASLAHDDLPCFDDAATRRGRPTVHCAYGEPLAVLSGDALIVLAFDAIARAGVYAPTVLPGLLLCISQSAGMPSGIVAGQAWESESEINLSQYHRSKTGALFVAATVAGAISAGAEPDRWRQFGEALGEAYQVADDLRDVADDAETLGKPVDRDAALGRPSAVTQFGVMGAVGRLKQLVGGAIEAIPPCGGADELRALVASEAKRLTPKSLALQAA